MGSGTVLRVFTHKRRENPYFSDFFKFFGPERPMKARSIPWGYVGGYFLVIAGMRPSLFYLPSKFNATWNFAPRKIAVTQNCYELLNRRYEGRGTTNPWFFHTPLELKG